MSYSYLPGCSLEHSAIAYHQSTMAIASRLGLEFVELTDWNCCGATEYISVELIPAYALSGRNLALAAQHKAQGHGDQLVAPCSACFLNLCNANRSMADSPELAEKVNIALSAGGMHYDPDSVRVRHLLDVIVNDIGYEAITQEVSRPLYGLRISPYYGCLIVRPGFDGGFDDSENPTSMEKLLRGLGAVAVDFPLKTQCCGGHMTQIMRSEALELIRRLLQTVADSGADLIVTPCPMCQLNLDVYQSGVNHQFGTDFHIPILYFTQLMGLAFGMTHRSLGIGREFTDAKAALSKISAEPPHEGKPAHKRPPKEALPMPMIPEEW
ncbi:MAG: disulfide reductase [Anaerolineales bacterium]|nr:disulfide reductase [Anaerolineales bacterium]